MSGSSRVITAAALTVVLAGGGGVAGAGRLAGARTGDGRSPTRGRVSAVRYSVQIQAVFNAAGHSLLVANFNPNGSLVTPHWLICSPSPRSTCMPAHTRDRALDPGPRPAGTVFRATARYLGRTYAAQVTWHGRVTAVSRPSLAGHPRVGAQVFPIPARWRGGWGAEFDQLGVEACPTRTARRCVTVSGGQLGCPEHTPAVLRSSIKGWYVFALDARLPADQACAGVGYSSESAIPVWPIGQTVARSAPRGPVRAR
jgi:hypothetical protein